MATQEENIYYELKKLSNLFARRILGKRSKKLAGNKISRSQAMMLAYIIDRQDKEKIYQKDIEEVFSIRRSTATETLKKLEEAKAIVRVQSKTDKRLKEIIPTEKTLSLKLDLQKNIHQLSSMLFVGITESELESFKNTLMKMRLNLEKDPSCNQ